MPVNRPAAKPNVSTDATSTLEVLYVNFVIHPEVFHYFPGMRIAVAVVRGVDNTTERPSVAADLQAAWMATRTEMASYSNPQSHPRVRLWRERFKAMGIKAAEFPSSIEALLRRAMKTNEPLRINPLVDFYNSVSLRHIVPVGGFDLGQLQSDVELRLTRPGDWFMALDAQEPLYVPQGEVAYATGDTILTRHFVWRQAQTGLIVPSTTDVLLVSEILGELEDWLVDQVLEAFWAGLEKHFAVTPQLHILNQARAQTAIG